MHVEWDLAKVRSNLAKHGISFWDVEPAFNDKFAITIPDVFLVFEERFIMIGTDALDRMLTVSYTYRNNAVRIISARLAAKSERKTYEKGIRL